MNIIMIKVKLSSKRGKNMYERGCRYDGTHLDQIYGKYSDEKRKAYDSCYYEYLNSENHAEFSIISHNSFGFSVSWICTIGGHNGMRIETPKNSYFIDFEE